MLAGLSTAPQYVVIKHKSLDDGCVLATDVDSVVLPINACGGDGALAFAKRLKKKVALLNLSLPFILCLFIYLINVDKPQSLTIVVSESYPSTCHLLQRPSFIFDLSVFLRVSILSDFQISY